MILKGLCIHTPGDWVDWHTNNTHTNVSETNDKKIQEGATTNLSKTNY